MSHLQYTTITEEQLPGLLEENQSELTGFDFSEISFSGHLLKNLTLIDCKFTNCNLANVSVLNLVLRGVVFKNSNLMGVNWTEARRNGDYHFEGCKLDYGCFQSMDLRGMKFLNCSLKEADFSDCNLSKSNFTGSMLAGATFSNVNIEKADFRGARQYLIDPRFAKMKEAKFSFPEVVALIQALGVEVDF